jgi:hypothetical protein
MILKKKEIREHFIGLAFFTALFAALIFFVSGSENENKFSEIKSLLTAAELNPENELDAATLLDAIKNYYKNSPKADALIAEYFAYKEFLLTARENKSGADVRSLDFSLALSLLGKAALFAFYFALIGFLLFYLSESFALLKFKRKNCGAGKQQKKAEKENAQIMNLLKKAGEIILAAAGYFILFSPVYLIGYLFKFNYENVTFFSYVILSVFTNGVLITSANKFYRLLESESVKGYVETAKIKGVNYDCSADGKITATRIFSPFKFFGEHILTQIYKSAHLQYLSAFKEIARFQITGMIIVELALNLQNGIFYELLKALKGKETAVAIFILMLVFFVVKASDIVTDYLFLKENAKYEN